MDGRLGPPARAALNPTALGHAAIQHWLVARVAQLAREAVGDIDVTLPFSCYALDSAATVGLIGELEDWLQRSLPPTLIWDYPSIEQLAGHLAAAEAT